MRSFSSAGLHTGVAWLSSARVVRCWVKSRNERNPYPYLPAVRPGTIRKLPVINWRKVGMMSSHHGPYGLGYTHATMAITTGKRYSNVELILQKSSQFGLRAATRPQEVGIASNRESARRGEYVLGSCTHCPSSHGSCFYPNMVS